uniref:Trypsin alkaline C-like n=1 Tax=Tineola bisselliella TaxID=93883 RepID=A0A891XIE8_TINBI|nr:trypsin alkaline C-like [Tineola bisselliella]
MRAIALVLAVSLAAVLAVPRNPQRIVGGTVTNIGNWPFASSLLFSWNGQTFSQACGGTILTSTAILSAAHCFHGDPANRWRARVGSTNANSGGVVHVLRLLNNHQAYNPRNFDNDVAVLRTSTNIVWNNNVQAGSIAGSNYQLGDNQVVWAIGWGAISFQGPPSEQLRQVQIWTVNQALCRSRYAELGMTVTDNMLCSGWLDVGGRDQCQGDSGGPLLHNRIVVGVSSWGHQCALPRFPGVNARVSRFTSWIQAAAS